MQIKSILCSPIDHIAMKFFISNRTAHALGKVRNLILFFKRQGFAVALHLREPPQIIVKNDNNFSHKSKNYVAEKYLYKNNY